MYQQRYKELIDIVNNADLNDLQLCTDAAKPDYASINTKLSMNTVCIYAEKDNKAKYRQIREKYYRYSILMLKTKSSYDVSSILRFYFEGVYIFCDNKFYRFNNSVWELTEMFKPDVRHELVILRDIVMDLIYEIKNGNLEYDPDMPKNINEYSAEYSMYDIGMNLAIKELMDLMELTKISKRGEKRAEGPEGEDPEEAPEENSYDDYLNTIKEYMIAFLYDLYSKLGNIAYVANVISELCLHCLMDVETFSELRDSKLDLVTFANGVYDLTKGEFRNASPNDFSTVTTGYDFVKDYSQDHVDFVLDRFKEFFPDIELRKWILVKMASFFYGKNKYQEFYIFQGVGSNGKSVLLDFINKMMGQYSTSVSVSLLTSKRTASAQASPDLAKTIGKRLVTMQEPDYNASLQPGLLKELTGCDRITARALYSSPIEFVPQFKMILCCNDLPNITGVDDEGTWRRMRIIPFESRFVDKDNEKLAEKKLPNYFPRDTDIVKKMNEYISDFVSYLLQEQYKYIFTIECPQRVKMSTTAYRAEGDTLQDFIDTCLIYDPDCVCQINELYSYYKQWVSDNYSVKVSESKKTFQKKFSIKTDNCVNYRINY